MFRYEGDVLDARARDLPGLKAKFLVERVPDGDIVLDVGCGGGKMLRTLARERPAAQLFGCDVRPPAQQTSAFDFRLIEPSGRLPYEDESIDTALVIDVLEHVTDPIGFLDEVSRVLRPRGRLVAFIPVEGQKFSFYRLFRRVLGEDLYVQTKDHVQAFSRGEVMELIETQFDIDDQRYAYHLFGHMMDATLYAMLRVDGVNRMFWTQSPYHNRDQRRSLTSSIFAAALMAANRVAWAESVALASVPFTSAGILLAARRR